MDFCDILNEIQWKKNRQTTKDGRLSVGDRVIDNAGKSKTKGRTGIIVGIGPETGWDDTVFVRFDGEECGATPRSARLFKRI